LHTAPPAAATAETAAGANATKKTEAVTAKPEAKATIIKALPGSMRTGFMGEEAKEVATEGITDPLKQKIVLNFDKADVVEVSNQIFGEYLKFNYVMDPSLRGQISLYLDGEFTKQELLQLITRAYNASNIDIVPEKGLYHIQTLQRTPSSKLPIGGPQVLKDDKSGTKPVIIIYRLRYLDATQAMNTLKFFIGRTG
jgi:general secretion pathway protein D